MPIAVRWYSSALTRLWEIQKPGMRRDLSPMRELTSNLGDPWKAFPSVLVAGTNGKGSTCAVLSEILSAAGYKVGVYTSPHLSFYRERIAFKEKGRIAPFNESLWCSCFALLEEAAGAGRYTQFEILTALALLMFKAARVDIAVLEAGMGGELDAVNVVEPAESVICRIDYDHQEYLGKSLAEIASAKAGILRRDCPALIIAQPEEAFTKLQEESRRRGALLTAVGSPCLRKISLEGQTFEYQGKMFHQALLGAHQAANAVLALEAARSLSTLGFPVSQKHIEEGIKNARWPARLERLGRSPQVLVDGAHNAGGCAALAEALNALNLNRPQALILGILEDKNIPDLLKALSPWGDAWFFARSKSPRAASPEKLLETARDLGIQKEFYVTARVGEACRLALRLAGPAGSVAAAGSLTTAGEARRVFKAIQS